MVTYQAKKSLRKDLARPWGTLVPAVDDDTLLTAQKVWDLLREEHGDDFQPVITIGDVVTESFIEAGIPIRLAIIDGKTKRGIHEISGGNFTECRSVDNPTGEISAEAWTTIKDTIDGGEKTVIAVNGEEDLLVLPVVAEAPLHTIVAYGQPPQTDLDPPLPPGVVFFTVTPETKQIVHNLLSKFSKS